MCIRDSQKLYLQSLPAGQELPALDGLPSLYALKLYELHKLNDLSALSHSCLLYTSLVKERLQFFLYLWLHPVTAPVRTVELWQIHSDFLLSGLLVLHLSLIHI